jgi:hypothetical protein
MFSTGVVSAGVSLTFFLLCAGFCAGLRADPIPAAFKQGTLHGFLVLKSQDGTVIAAGDQINTVRNGVVKAELVFHFKDGSLDDEVAYFRQGRTITLLRDHHVQKGPSFPQPLDMAIDVPKGEVTWQSTKDGKISTQTKQMKLPADLMNGILALAVENYPAHADEVKGSFLAGDPAPRVVEVSFTRQGEDHVEVGGEKRSVARFNMHIKIGGLAGAVAPLIGKEPTDITFWATEDAAPVVIRTEGSLFLNGPVWNMEFESPVWPESTGGK